MSAGLEVAAGAFAVVGVLDVLIKAGREVHRFLCDISDAPQDLQTLCALLDQTIILIGNSRRSLASLQSCTGLSPDIPNSLAGTIKAIDRQVQELKRSIAKVTGDKKWTRIKFVLDQKKISKAVKNLDRLNSLLTSTLIQASSEENALCHRRIEEAVTQGFQQAQKDIAALDSDLAALKSSLMSRMNIEVQQNARRQSFDRCNVLTALKKQELLSKELLSGQQQNLKTTEKMKVDGESFSSQQRQTHALVQSLVDKIQELDATFARNNSQLRRDLKDISFLGDRPDRILSYLMSLQDNLDKMVNYVVSVHGTRIPMGHVRRLQDEVQNMISSASQEQARKDVHSSARPIDIWTYPEDAIGFLRSESKKRKAPDNCSELKTMNAPIPPRKRRKTYKSSWSVTTESGNLFISVPDSEEVDMTNPDFDEIGFKCTIKQNEKRYFVCARFLRDLTHATKPRLYGQLHVFVEGEEYDEYRRLASEGTLQDFDKALREGVISIFQADMDGNVLLWSLAAWRRTDLLDYLEAQGVPLNKLEPDRALTWGLSKYGNDSPADSDMAFIRKISEKLDDSTAILASTALSALLDMFAIGYDAPRNARLFAYCLCLLGEHRYMTTDYGHLLYQYNISEDMGSLLQKLLQYIESPEEVLGERNVLWYFVRMIVVAKSTISRRTINILSAMFDLDLDIHEPGLEYGVTISMYIRRMTKTNLWNIWCELIIRKGRSVQDIVKAEDNDWLLGHDFREHWKRLDIISYLRVGDETEDLSVVDDDLWLDVFEEPRICAPYAEITAGLMATFTNFGMAPALQ